MHNTASKKKKKGGQKEYEPVYINNCRSSRKSTNTYIVFYKTKVGETKGVKGEVRMDRTKGKVGEIMVRARIYVDTDILPCSTNHCMGSNTTDEIEASINGGSNKKGKGERYNSKNTHIRRC